MYRFIKTGNVYEEKLQCFIHIERNLDYGFHFRQAEVFLSKIPKAS